MAELTKYEALDLLLSGKIEHKSKFKSVIDTKFKRHHLNCNNLSCSCNDAYDAVLNNIEGWVNSADERSSIIFNDLKQCWETERNIEAVRKKAKRFVYDKSCAAFIRILLFVSSNQLSD